eukprot:gb/GFBE01009526.1/.p1 GENE.gb/GFBE01009526.1/~~gb/GFBE01009526.1/.p1  ORF type:complete len:133 (+),score=28.53 gb/GFBE01009526.1/:1-399(+)
MGGSCSRHLVHALGWRSSKVSKKKISRGSPERHPEEDVEIFCKPSDAPPTPVVVKEIKVARCQSEVAYALPGAVYDEDDGKSDGLPVHHRQSERTVLRFFADVQAQEEHVAFMRRRSTVSLCTEDSDEEENS